MAEVNSRRAAELIREKTGRPCTRQNLETHCRNGRLPLSTLCLNPIRIDPDLVADEFLAMVSPEQAATRPRPALIENRLQHPATLPPEEIPDYNISRARSEFEKANLLELERKTKEALLIPREQVEKVWANAATIARTKLLALPTRARQRIPHLTLEEVAILEELQREALEELSGGD